jgi:hypothetical protein
LSETADELNRQLSAWHGAMVQWWEYGVSHGRLVLRISKPGTRGNIHLICGDCKFVRGPTAWDHSALTARETERRNVGASFVVEDPSADVEIRCNIVVVAENVEPVY